MFGWFRKDGLRQKEKRYHRKLEAAMQAQRGGDIQSCAELTREADVLFREIEDLKQKVPD